MPPPALLEGFAAAFGGAPQLMVRAPGRVNLIGDHTDYCGGLALPVAVQLATYVAVRSRSDGRLRAVAKAMRQEWSWSIADALPSSDAPVWTRFLAGIVGRLRGLGAAVPGCEVWINGDLPVGAGLSSSAALCVGFAKALATLCGEALTPDELVDLVQAVEQQDAGVPCGILDPTAILMGKAGHALLLDCRTRSTTLTPMPAGAHEFLLIDSGVRRELSRSPYSLRRSECDSALKYFQGVRPGVKTLRDLDPELVRRHASQMDPLAAARALHVTSENRRVQQFSEALTQADGPLMGRLMNDSHASLRDQFEASTPEIERLIEIVASDVDVLGARITGAGFGGSICVLARRGSTERLRKRLQREYDRPPRRPATLIEIVPSNGAGFVR